jgi:recombination protein RecA
MRIVRFPRTAKEQYTELKSREVRKIAEKINQAYHKSHKKSKRNAVALLGESIFAKPTHYAASGILPIDCTVCGGRGFPIGIIEIYGGEATSKTAVLENILAESQRRGYHTGIFPMEFSLDYHRSKVVGIDSRKLMVFEEAETIEDVYELIKLAVKKVREEDKTTPIVLGIDTIASTPTRTEMESKKGLDEHDMGRMALQVSKLFRRLVKFLMVNKVCLICINQTRVNLGVRYGDKETTPGGKALKFYAWVRCRMRRVKKIFNSDDKSIGILCEMETTKNKVYPPFRKCKFYIYWNRGIDKVEAVWEYAIDQEVFTQKGSSYRYEGKIVRKKHFQKFYLKHKEAIDRALVESTRVS